MTDRQEKNIQEIILGKVPSKSNCYKIIKINGKSTIGKSAAVESYERKFFLQCKHRKMRIKNYFALRLDVFYETNSPDLDNSLKVILDCLQKCEVIVNDRYCTEIHARKFVDKKNPRVEIVIEIEDN